MKKSFTMIELIFVIVILGILAAVAIPKLIATRDDARTVALATQIKAGTKELISYYTSQGGEINFSKFPTTSQVALNELIDRGWMEVKSDTKAVFYDDRNTKTVCLIYTTNGEQFEVEQNTTNNSTLCKDIKRIIKDRNYSVLNGAISF